LSIVVMRVHAPRYSAVIGPEAFCGLVLEFYRAAANAAGGLEARPSTAWDAAAVGSLNRAVGRGLARL
jgi:hypothetical protein